MLKIFLEFFMNLNLKKDENTVKRFFNLKICFPHYLAFWSWFIYGPVWSHYKCRTPQVIYYIACSNIKLNISKELQIFLRYNIAW